MPIDHGRGTGRGNRRARIDKLKDQAAELAGGMVDSVSPGCPPEIEEQFWEQSLRSSTLTVFHCSTC
jgi:hypothetical protein